MTPLHLGPVRIDRIVEIEGLGYEPTFFFPESTLDEFHAELGWLAPHFWDTAANTYKRSIQCYLVRTERHTILVDACVGNDKERPSTKLWHRQSSNWLEQLGALGVAPEDVDYVLCTHLHADHVGWNTRLLNGRWVPTFPNARYVIHKDEYRYWEAGGDTTTGPGTADGCFVDSVLPVMAAGQVTLVDNDLDLDERFVLLPTPGHSPGHMCIDVTTPHGRAVLAGDAMHHPVQAAHPEWNSRFCIDPARSRAERIRFVDRYAETGTVILAAHFASPTAGRIVANGARCKFAVI
jgi:glyoxylase-like metal-dependent hydrolase (beta-lactamase superfamily II)